MPSPGQPSPRAAAHGSFERPAPGLWVEVGHPELAEARLSALAGVFVRRGAAVRVFSGADNSIARLPHPDGGGFRALVQVEGLANLAHELVHALLAGRIDDDHGIDYGRIPFDLDTLEGRAMLWDELAACAWSCAFGAGDPVAWFAEQVEIQPVFYGLERDPAAFEARVTALLAEYGEEALAMVTRAGVLLDRALAERGLAVAARPSRDPDLMGLWRAHRVAKGAEGGRWGPPAPSAPLDP